METSDKFLKLGTLLGIDLDSYGKDEDEMLELYDDMIDTTNPEISVLGCTCKPSKYLKDNDPTAYRCGFVDWTDAERDVYDEFNGRWYTENDVEEIKEAFNDAIDEL